MAKTKDIINIQSMSKSQAQLLLEVASEMKKIISSRNKKAPQLVGKSVATVYFNNDEFSKQGFNLATKYLSGNIIDVDNTKIELKPNDILTKLDLMSVDIIVTDASEIYLSNVDNFQAGIIKVGGQCDICSAMTNLFTIKDHFDSISNLKVALIGDLNNSSAIADANILTKFGMEVKIASLNTLVPEELASYQVKTLDDALKGANVILNYDLTSDSDIISLIDYEVNFDFNDNAIRLANPTSIILYSENSALNRLENSMFKNKDKTANKITNSVAVKMAILYLASR